MIYLKDVCLNIDKDSILHNVNLNIKKGKIYGLIGKNGAGKTSLIKCLTGIWKIDNGELILNGEKPYENVKVKQKLGYVSENSSLYHNFSVNEMIKFYSLAYTSFNSEKLQRINLKFKIDLNKKVRALTKGMKMKLALMLNLSIDPEILVLDEPISGIDPIAKKDVIDFLLEEVADNQTTIFISSHNIYDMEKICDDIGIIDNGTIIYQSSLEKMKTNIKKIQVVFKEEKELLELKKFKTIININKVGRVYQIVTKEFNDEFISKIKDMNSMIIEEIDLSLEEMFIYSLGGRDSYEQVL